MLYNKTFLMALQTWELLRAKWPEWTTSTQVAIITGQSLSYTRKIATKMIKLGIISGNGKGIRAVKTCTLLELYEAVCGKISLGTTGELAHYAVPVATAIEKAMAMELPPPYTGDPLDTKRLTHGCIFANDMCRACYVVQCLVRVNPRSIQSVNAANPCGCPQRFVDAANAAGVHLPSRCRECSQYACGYNSDYLDTYENRRHLTADERIAVDNRNNRDDD